MIAYVDESIRSSGHRLYVVAAVVVIDDPQPPREAMLSMVLPAQRRYHWHDESHARRLAMVDRIAGLGVTVFGYVHRDPGARQERARALCLRRALWDMHQHGVAELVIETRHASADRRDRQTIVRAQQAGEAAATLVYGFEKPDDQPLLWLPDAAAGAIAAAAAGETLDYLGRLGRCVEVVEVGT